MKKRILSLVLVAVMILSTFAIIPVTAATENTWDFDKGVYKISTYEDLQAFSSKVYGKTDFSGKTVTLEADINLPDTFTAIGPNNGGAVYFCGTFDGQGHTITFNNTSDDGQGQYGLFRRLKNATIKNLNLKGTTTIATQDSYAGALAMETNGNCLIQNVHSSVNLEAKKGVNVYYVGGFISYIKNESGAKLTFDGCVYDGKMNFPNYTRRVGGFVGYFENSGASLTIKNSAYAGTIMLNATDYSVNVGGFVGEATTVTMTDSISVGKITFLTGVTWTEDGRGTLIGQVKTATLSNVYYIDVAAPEGYSTAVLPAISKPTNTPNLTKVAAKTSDEIASLTAADFSASNALSFKENTAAARYYPCPTGLVPATGWLTGLTSDIVNFSASNPVIGNAADMKLFAEAVNGGNTFAGKTVKLVADVDLSGIDWAGIGATSSKPFSGSFDGQGYTIYNMTQSTTNPDGKGGLFNFVRIPANSTCVIENFTLTGKMDVKLSSGTGYCVGTVVSCVDAGTSGNGGTFTMRNVHSSVSMTLTQSGSCSAVGFGGLLGFTRHATDVKPITVNIDSCVYSGNMNMGTNVYHCGGIMGTVGDNVTNRPVTVNISNTVFSGNVSLNGFFDHFGLFVSMTRRRVGESNEDRGGSVAVNLTDCVSTAQVYYNEGLNYGSSAIGVATAHLRSTMSLNVKNVYYRPVNAPKNGEMVAIEMVYSGATASNYTVDANSGALAMSDIAKLDASAFSADCKLSFKPTEFDTYYPCPTSLLGENGEWLPALFAENTGSTKVLGAQIRCTGESDLYSGIRFVGQFKADAVSNAGTADANFGLILIAKEFYDAAEDKATIEGLLVAGGQDVQATQVDGSIEGYYRVNAVVYEITADHYADEIVAIAYIDGELVGDATTRSIYQVATKCVADSNATAAQKTFCNGIINSVEG